MARNTQHEVQVELNPLPADFISALRVGYAGSFPQYFYTTFAVSYPTKVEFSLTKHSTMILRLLFSTLLVWATFQTKVQGQKNEYKVDSVFVYRNFDQCGTTANLWQNHRVLDSLKYGKRKFSQEDVKNLDDMLKLFKQKGFSSKNMEGKFVI